MRLYKDVQKDVRHGKEDVRGKQKLLNFESVQLVVLFSSSFFIQPPNSPENQDVEHFLTTPKGVCFRAPPLPHELDRAPLACKHCWFIFQSVRRGRGVVLVGRG